MNEEKETSLDDVHKKIFSIQLSNFIQALYYSLQKSKSHSLIIQSVVKKNPLQFIQVTMDLVVVVMTSAYIEFKFEHKKVYAKKKGEAKFSEVSKEDQEIYFEGLNQFFQLENNSIVWAASMDKDFKPISVSQLPEMTDLTNYLHAAGYEILTNKSKQFEQPFNTYLLLLFKKRQGAHVKKGLDQFRNQMNTLLKAEGMTQLFISKSSKGTSYDLNFTNDEATINVHTNLTNSFVIDFNRYTLQINGDPRQLIDFKELDSFFTMLNNDMANLDENLSIGFN